VCFRALLHKVGGVQEDKLILYGLSSLRKFLPNVGRTNKLDNVRSSPSAARPSLPFLRSVQPMSAARSPSGPLRMAIHPATRPLLCMSTVRLMSEAGRNPPGPLRGVTRLVCTRPHSGCPPLPIDKQRAFSRNPCTRGNPCSQRVILQDTFALLAIPRTRATHVRSDRSSGTPAHGDSPRPRAQRSPMCDKQRVPSGTSGHIDVTRPGLLPVPV
jgi:hypothetical protein